jgi:exopolysaccharide biosynthesis polyprenyl glycosylphosphotransferase
MDSLTYNLEGTIENQPAPGAVRELSRAGQRSAVLRRFLLGADIFAAVLAGGLSGLVFGMTILEVGVLTLALLGGSVLLAFVFGLYGDADLQTWASGLTDAPRVLVAALLLAWPVLGVAELAGFGNPALVALVATAATASFDSLSRAFARGRAHRIVPLRQRTVLVGSGMVADRLAERLSRHGEFGLDVIGLVDDDVHTLNGAARLSKLGSLHQLDDVLKEAKVDRVIVTFSRASHEELLGCIRTCRDNRVDVDVVPRLFELLDGAQTLSQIGGLPLLAIGAPPLTPLSKVAKRVLDVVVSASILTLFSPVLLLTAVAIKIDSRGPIFFRQVRAGRGNSRFKLIKFRSMYRDAEERKRQFERENEAKDNVMFKIKRDPRVTRIGRFMRRSSIDEIPQLFNVLTGEMSLVGPRPLILEEAKEANKTWAARRLDLRPGITGLWQVSGRSDLPFEEMVAFDYQYVSGWSLARDVEILLATIPVVITGRGAY